MRIAFASARSAPGVTTAMLAFASTWPGPVLLVEASEDGGALAARFGLRLEPGMTTLAAATRHDADASVLAAHTQALPGTDGRISALVGPSTPEAAQLLLRNSGERLARLLAAVDGTVFVDAGRLSVAPAAAPLLAGADRQVLVVRPRVEELQTLAHRLPVLRDQGIDPQVLLVGSEPYGVDEVAATLDVAVLGALADDRTAADALAGVTGGRRLARSLLLRSAASLVDRLLAPSPPRPTGPTSSSTPAAWTSSPVGTGQGGDR